MKKNKIVIRVSDITDDEILDYVPNDIIMTNAWGWRKNRTSLLMFIEHVATCHNGAVLFYPPYDMLISIFGKHTKDVGRIANRLSESMDMGPAIIPYSTPRRWLRNRRPTADCLALFRDIKNHSCSDS